MTSEEILLVEQRESVRILTFNRPEARNALSSALIDALRAEIAAADTDDETNVVVLTGTDPAFCAGLDLQELGESGGNLSLVSGADLPVGHPWKPISKPIIGAVNGAAITGGLEMALACDFLIASERARFADTHARVGVLPGWGLTQRLPAAVGPGFARRMSLSGNFVGAEEALRAGLVTQVVAHDELLDTALEVARTIAGNDQPGVRALLASYRRAEEHVVEPALQVEQQTSEAWMREFSPARVAERRAAVIERGKSQNAVNLKS
ncbi:enoyl-CoA hydratase [Rhodococcus rhodochrous J3]|uniref:Enoyl-CoA hydratase n=2 Tax=Rhodococcus rhodochrous TaxID=1829 RepID=A0AA46WU30_RHORH|nr:MULTISPECIES: enoyl-CoA hydratase [Rhodococcus]AYA23915.1 enoyl-CoA hydratase [Rhodococcus rhodochrous]MBF4480116.1 enoyl-CoA hydratase [Rhodococcus rhodochrous]MCB8910154.1 enoyl-CoA hydratase [Rhodococcus rhodochrous]MDC3727344.1 enoyl-CoA hydratase [Rhodococcus sp. Rp3]MDO1485595.1 enoyl-CoA hydratase [Rhodococcus rhodochrous]